MTTTDFDPLAEFFASGFSTKHLSHLDAHLCMYLAEHPDDERLRPVADALRRARFGEPAVMGPEEVAPAGGPTLDLDAIRRRHEAFEVGWVWDHDDFPPEQAIRAAASAEDVPALVSEVQRLRAVADAAIAWRAQFADPVDLMPVAWPRRAALVAAVDDLRGGQT